MEVGWQKYINSTIMFDRPKVNTKIILLQLNKKILFKTSIINKESLWK